MDVGAFFSRLGRKPPTPMSRTDSPVIQPLADKIETLHGFETAWLNTQVSLVLLSLVATCLTSVQALLLEPDQRQLYKGINATNIPLTLDLLLDALRTEVQTGE